MISKRHHKTSTNCYETLKTNFEDLLQILYFKTSINKNLDLPRFARISKNISFLPKFEILASDRSKEASPKSEKFGTLCYLSHGPLFVTIHQKFETKSEKQSTLINARQYFCCIVFLLNVHSLCLLILILFFMHH